MASGAPVRPVVAIVGPTAAGKSALAIKLAKMLSGEVVNADSMQLYVGMDVGSAKLTVAEREGIPHHLLDVWPVTRTTTLAEYQALALDTVAAIQGRGSAPILVGGSGMYVHAVLDRWHIPGTDPNIRRSLEGELQKHGASVLHERLALVDAPAAQVILPTDARRIVRALEVVALEGSFSATLPARDETEGRVLIGIDIPRQVVDQRIGRRVEQMWAAGFVEEVQGLVDVGLRDGLTASRAIGYAQILRYLAGECSEAEAKQDTIRATRKFARRQDSWFRRDERVAWLPYDAPDLLEQAAAVVGPRVQG